MELWLLATYTRIFCLRGRQQRRDAVLPAPLFGAFDDGATFCGKVGALEGDGLPYSGVAGDVKRAIAAVVCVLVGIADAPTDIVGAMRV